MDRALEPSGLQTDGPGQDGDERSRYSLVRSLGKGGTGETHEGYVAMPDGSQRRVAVKILHDNPGDEVGRLRRFVQLTAQLEHPNVSTPFEFIASSAGRVVLTDYVEGMTLVEMQRRLKRLGRALPVNLALEIIAQALEGLIYLHAPNQFPGFSPLVHRTIKPSNLFIGADGGVRILDLGVLSPQAEAGARSKGLAVVNLLPYLAPEMLSDAPRPTPATDIYGLGTVAYELLAGRLLFDGSAARRELEIRVGFGVQDKVRALESVVAGATRLLSRPLALVPGDRGTAAEMLKELVGLKPEPQREALAELIVELQAMPEKPLSVVRPADAPTAVGQPARSDTEIRRQLQGNTLIKVPKVEPIPAHLLPDHRPGRDRRVKVGIGVVSVAIAALALWWVDRNRQPDPLEGSTATDRALATDPKPAAPPATSPASDETHASNRKSP